jgi:hypothetical protein
MSNIRYAEYKEKQRGRYFWGVLSIEGTKQGCHTMKDG